MKLTQLLADYARVSDNKLDVLGAGWTVYVTGCIAFFVAGMLQIPYDRTDDADHTIRLELLDADGRAVVGPQGPIHAEASIHIARSPETAAGVPADLPFVIPFGPFGLEPGARYEIRTTINGEQREDWSLPFSIRTTPPGQLAA